MVDHHNSLPAMSFINNFLFAVVASAALYIVRKWWDNNSRLKNIPLPVGGLFLICFLSCSTFFILFPLIRMVHLRSGDMNGSNLKMIAVLNGGNGLAALGPTSKLKALGA